jgi:hypothetical protein
MPRLTIRSVSRVKPTMSERSATVGELARHGKDLRSPEQKQSGGSHGTEKRERSDLQLWSVFRSASISMVPTVENVSDMA